jgi:mono/diheme cytochrome c family protein
MRHLLANLATYAIAAFLFAGAGMFAWLRSGQVVLARETDLIARWEPAPGEPFDWEALGAGTYVRNCANCHGRAGRGWDQYPGLDRTARLFLLPGGLEHVIDLHLYGLSSRRSRAPMPAMGHLEDVETAAVINHVLSHFGNEGVVPPGMPLLRPEEVAARRGQRLGPGGVERRRPLVPEE